MVPVIPIPKKYTEYNEAPLSLPLQAQADLCWQKELTVLGELFLQITGSSLEEGPGGIHLCKDASLAPDAYSLI